MENLVVSNFLSNVLKREWFDKEERLGYTQELIVDVADGLKEHARNIDKAWDEDEIIYKTMYEIINEKDWEEMKGKRIFFLNAIKIDDKKREKGYGTKILSELEKEANKRDANEIHLVIQEVGGLLKTKDEEEKEKEKAVKWFEKRGYKIWIENKKTYMVKKI